MGNPDRLSSLDASFLHLEEGGAHMHVGSCMLFEGVAPSYEEFVAQLDRRLHLVPRYRQKLAFVPLNQARPVWVDDPHFNAGYHIRHTALPEPAGMQELRALSGRVLSGRLDRSKPLWEIWLVDRVAGERFAVISKTHHCLVDGVSGVDVTNVLFDLEPEPELLGDDRSAPPPPWEPRPEPSAAALLADALLERTTAPVELAREMGGALTRPMELAERAGTVMAGIGAVAMAGMNAPPSPYNTPIGPHRRFAWVEDDLARLKGVKSSLGGTINDVVLTAVTGALRTHLRARKHVVEGLTLRAMVPVSVRAEAERGALGNRVSAVYAPLPVSVADPAERYRIVREAMAGLKESGQAVGAEVLTRLTGFAPPTVLAQSARLQTRQRMFNLTVTNVPGPQFPLYLLGRRLQRIFPQVPLAGNAALGIAIMSYDGTINFGLIGDFDVLSDLDELALALEDALDELSALAGEPAPTPVGNGRVPADVTSATP
ncbi:MAG: wax ester/triacylglycerol synthase family O-acyltransferase [Solirubrobacterales bacterium]|jgi:diacylglycerol O-acyltransferase|nr:wax ester/triacylglycerol synthase family O-acyltransferase [Solirubrobacterales bacterium]